MTSITGNNILWVCFFQEDDFLDIIKKLIEHYKREKESAVRVKILSLFGDIGSEAGADILVSL